MFANIGKNFRAPPNFAFAPTNGNVTITNGVAVLTGDIRRPDVDQHRHRLSPRTKAITFSATAFQVNFTDRQATAFDPNTLKSIYTNAGRAHPRCRAGGWDHADQWLVSTVR